MSPLYDVSMVGFGISFIKKRFGGSAMTAKLVSRMTMNAAAHVVDSAGPFLNNIMRRVFGGRGSEVISYSVQKELSRMVFQRPMCNYMSSLQVIRLN